MADISKITLPDNTTYNIKDNNARNFTNTPYYEQDEEALMFQLGESYITGEQDNQPYLFRAAGGSADIGNREYDKIIGGTVAWNQLVRNEASTNETDFADIVTVDDAVEDAAAVKVTIEPVQDLHGYDHPWPGGGTKNKMPNAIPKTETINGITFKLDNFGVFTVKGTATDIAICNFPIGFSFVIPDDPDSKFVLNNTQATYTSFRFFNNSTQIDTWNMSPVNRVSPYTVMSGKTCNSYRIYVPSGTTVNMTISPMFVESSITDYTYIPYSNICPITGWDGVKVTRVAENLLGGDALKSDLLTNISRSSESDGNVTIPTGAIGYLGFDKFEEGEQYTFILDLLPTGTYLGFQIEFDDDTMQTKFTGLTKNERQTVVAQSMAGKTIKAVRVAAGASAFTVYPETSGIFKGVLSAEDFESYRGNIYSVDWTSEAGTVYGGTLDVSTGKLVVDRISAQLTGTAIATSWATEDANRDSMGFYTNRQNWRANTGLPLPVEGGGVFDYCHVDIIYATDNWWAARFLFINGQFNRFEMRIPKNVLSTQDISGAKAYLNEHPLQVVYKIAPQTYTFTPTEIRTLLGMNNVWADTGQTALTYTGTDEHLTLESGRKYFTRISDTDSMLLGSGQEITVEKGMNNVFDLTQMFGSTIANYIYSLETATPGAGVAWFRKLFPKPYYEYNPGELMSVQAVAHKLVGFNAWDEEWELGIINTTTGEETDSNSNIRSKNYIRVIPGATYYFKLGTTDISNNIVFYDAGENYVAALGEHVDDTFTVPENAHYMKFYMSTNYGSVYLSNICINLSGDDDGEYESYEEHSYPLDSSLILRGIPKLDANNQLYYDGDVYEADGTVTRKYGIVDLGTLSYTRSISGLFRSNSLSNTIKKATQTLVASELIFSALYSEIGANPITGPDGTNPSPNMVMAVSGSGSLFFNNISYTDVAAFKAAMSGVYLIYKLATPTTETAEPYDNPQIVASEGTEEYITTNIVFVGHETKY